MASVALKPSFRVFNANLLNPISNPLNKASFPSCRVKHCNNRTNSAISVSYRSSLNPPNSDSTCNNFNFSRNPFWVLLPILQSIGGFAISGTQKWISCLRGFCDCGVSVDEYSGDYLQNGGLGMVLLSVTSTARVRISPFVATLAANSTFMSAMVAWIIAQSSKVFLNFFVERKWDFRIFFASGGMPSSHSALCTALTTSVALCHGVADSLFPVCLGFSLIVMYDAIGVRRHAGMQAQVLNMIVEDLFQGHPISQRKLKELLGHTPSQVLAGALLGLVVACICCQSCLVAT